jgi:alkaline phosphatase
LAREFYQYKLYGKNSEKAVADTTGILPLDALLIGAVRTKSSDSFVTDSASAATAYSCGKKTYNAAIGVDPKGIPCATVLEAAKAKGFTTAMVVTSRITHATPASWSSHVPDRDMENEIAVQQVGDYPLGRSLDLVFGGGRRHYLPNSDPNSKRKDNRDLFKEAKEKFGWKTIIQTKNELKNLNASSVALPLMGLFANGHLDYEIDRKKKQIQPALSMMVKQALSILASSTSQCDSPGFFLMIEGSRIDHAAHANDISAHSTHMPPRF